MKTTPVEAGRHAILVVETILKQNTAMIRQNELILEKLLNPMVCVEAVDNSPGPIMSGAKAEAFKTGVT